MVLDGRVWCSPPRHTGWSPQTSLTKQARDSFLLSPLCLFTWLQATSSLDRMLDDVMLNGASGTLGSAGTLSRWTAKLQGQPECLSSKPCVSGAPSAPLAVPPPPFQTSYTSSKLLNGCSIRCCTSVGSRGSSGRRWQPQVISARREPFEDVQLGPLLGKGSYGRVYRAMWSGIPVAVKVPFS